MATEPKTIGVFAGLLTSKGKLRLQRRTEKGSIAPGKTFKGDWELSGGRVKETDLRETLTLEVLKKELIREVKEELGILIEVSSNFSIYRAVYEDPEKGICDWAFMIPIYPAYWNDNAKAKRETIDVNPDELRELANRPKGDQLVSGWGKRMCRMSLGAFYSFDIISREKVKEMLEEVKSDWRETEYFEDAERALAQFRRELGLE